MDDKKELVAGDPCPKCGGQMVLDRTQHPDTLIEHHRLTNPTNPELHGAYRRRVQDKAAEHGLIHRCASCPYQARFHEAVGAGAGTKKK